MSAPNILSNKIARLFRIIWSMECTAEPSMVGCRANRKRTWLCFAAEPGGNCKMTTVAITCVRNEGAYLIEWLAHHRAVGFDHFVVFTNDCSDQTCQVLDYFAGLGWVTHIPNPGPYKKGVFSSPRLIKRRSWMWFKVQVGFARLMWTSSSTSRRATEHYPRFGRRCRMQMPSP